MPVPTTKNGLRIKRFVAKAIISLLRGQGISMIVNDESLIEIVCRFTQTEDVKMGQKVGEGKYINRPYPLGTIGLPFRGEFEKQK